MNDLLADADICVKCGLCLPHCPTYTLTQNENESPRGRIALIQAWAGDHLEGSEKLVEHIDHCLLCRACEKACPAEVPYGRLIDNFRGRLFSRNHANFALFLLKKAAHNKTINRLAQSGLSLYQQTFLHQSARFLRLPSLFRLNSIDRILPDISPRPAKFKQHYSALVESKGKVGLFIGCMGSLLDQETVEAAVKVLTISGFDVLIPEQQTCCGALDLHDGDKETADELAKINCSAFDDESLTAIVTIASGCGSHLQEYQQSEFADKVVDISQFLSGVDSSSMRLQPSGKSVCLHTPCSLRNVMREEEGALKILQQIPCINIKGLPESVHCCGSAGSYILKHPKMAQALLDNLLTKILETQPDYLVSSNIGCLLHMGAGLRSRGIRMEVVHPVVLLARQLAD